MTSRSPFLITSIAILCIFGVRSLIGLPSAFVSSDYGEFTQAVRIGNIGGALLSVLTSFGLAYAQWRTRGKWGLGIGIFAIVIFVMQCFLMYLAVSSGRVSLGTFVVVKFVVFTVMGVLVLAVSSFVSFAQRPKRSA
jgi:hypothetical protein